MRPREEEGGSEADALPEKVEDELRKSEVGPMDRGERGVGAEVRWLMQREVR